MLGYRGNQPLYVSPEDKAKQERQARIQAEIEQETQARIAEMQPEQTPIIPTELQVEQVRGMSVQQAKDAGLDVQPQMLGADPVVFTPENVQRFAESQVIADQKEAQRQESLAKYGEYMDSGLALDKTPAQYQREISAQQTGIPEDKSLWTTLGDAYSWVGDTMGETLRGWDRDAENIITGQTYAEEKGQEMLQTEANFQDRKNLAQAQKKIELRKEGETPKIQFTPEEASAYYNDQKDAIDIAVDVTKQLATEEGAATQMLYEMFKYAPGDVVLAATGAGLLNVGKRIANLAKTSQRMQKLANIVRKSPKSASQTALAAEKAKWDDAYAALNAAVGKSSAMKDLVKAHGAEAITESILEHAQAKATGSDDSYAETAAVGLAQGAFNPLTTVPSAAGAISKARANKGRLAPDQIESLKSSLYSEKPKDIKKAAEREDILPLSKEVLKAQEGEKTKGLFKLSSEDKKIKIDKEAPVKGYEDLPEGEYGLRGEQAPDGFEEISVYKRGDKTTLKEEITHRVQGRLDEGTKKQLSDWEQKAEKELKEKGIESPVTGAELSAKKIVYDIEGTAGDKHVDEALKEVDFPVELRDRVMGETEGKAPSEMTKTAQKQYDIKQPKKPKKPSLKELQKYNAEKRLNLEEKSTEFDTPDRVLTKKHIQDVESASQRLNKTLENVNATENTKGKALQDFDNIWKKELTKETQKKAEKSLDNLLKDGLLDEESAKSAIQQVYNREGGLERKGVYTDMDGKPFDAEETRVALRKVRESGDFDPFKKYDQKIFKKIPAKTRQLISDAQEEIVDTEYPVERLVEHLRRSGADLGKTDIEGTARRLANVQQQRLMKLEETEIKGLYSNIVENGLSEEDIGLGLSLGIRRPRDIQTAKTNPDFRREGKIAHDVAQLEHEMQQISLDIVKIEKKIEHAEKYPHMYDAREKERMDAELDSAKKLHSDTMAKKKETIIPPSRENPGSGLSTQTAWKWRKILRDRPNAEALKKAVKSVQDLNLRTLKKELAGGLITQSQFNSQLKAYKGKYAPMIAAVADDYNPTQTGLIDPRTGGGASMKKGALGRFDESEVTNKQFLQNIVHNSVMRAYQVEAEVLKNKLRQEILEVVRRNPDPLLWVEDPDPPWRYERNEATGAVTKTQAPEKGLFMDVLEDGEPVRILFNQENSMMQAFHRSVMRKKMPSGTASRVLRAVHSHLKKMYTAFNLEFTPPNFVRDSEQALFNITADKSGKDAMKVMYKVFRENMAFLMREYMDVLPTDTRKKSQAKKLMMEDYERYVGKMGFVTANNVDDMKHMFKKVRKNAMNPKWASTKGAMMAPLNFINQLNESTENVWRFSVFEHMVKNGATKEEAGMYAKALTVDFGQTGSSDWMNTMWLFTSVALSSAKRFYQTVHRHPKKSAALATGLTSSLFALNFWNEAQGEDPVSGKPWWDLVSEHDKNHNMIIMTGKDGDYIKIPLQYILNITAPFANGAYDMLRGKKSFAEVSGNVANTAFNSFSPIGTSNLEGEDYLLATISPTAALPLVYAVTNKDWLGRDLVKPDFFNTQTSAHYRTRAQTSKTISKATRYLHKQLGGGETVRSGGLPEWMNAANTQMALETFTGGVGKTITKTIDAAQMAVDMSNTSTLHKDDPDKENFDSKKVPILRRFTGKGHTPSVFRKMSNIQNWVNGRSTDVRNLRKVWDEREGRRRKVGSKEDVKIANAQLDEYLERYSFKNKKGKTIAPLMTIGKRYNRTHKALRSVQSVKGETTQKYLASALANEISTLVEEMKAPEQAIHELTPEELGTPKHKLELKKMKKSWNKYDSTIKDMIKDLK